VGGYSVSDDLAQRPPTRYQDMTITQPAWEDERARDLVIADVCGFTVEKYVDIATLHDGSRILRVFGR
jgi:hypothetical protein